MPYFQMWREAWQDVDRAFKRMEHLSKMVNIASTQMIPKVHDRLAAAERKIKKFDPMLEQWESGGLVKQTVVEKVVEVPVAGDVKTPQRKKQKPRKEADYKTYQAVMQMLDAGLTAYRIGKELDISHQMVANYKNMPPERVERLRILHERGEQQIPGRPEIPLCKGELRKILDIQKQIPNIPVARLSALAGMSHYRTAKYLALSDAERAELLASGNGGA